MTFHQSKNSNSKVTNTSSKGLWSSSIFPQHCFLVDEVSDVAPSHSPTKLGTRPQS